MASEFSEIVARRQGQSDLRISSTTQLCVIAQLCTRCASAGTSLMPSLAIATLRPNACSVLTRLFFCWKNKKGRQALPRTHAGTARRPLYALRAKVGTVTVTRRVSALARNPTPALIPLLCLAKPSFEQGSNNVTENNIVNHQWRERVDGGSQDNAPVGVE
ncbi:MAG: hypothetical protein ACI9G1_000188 [Pirellulaceae bacterium]|jgi:hypothetical protein